jgi:hypothetical protein
MRALTLHQPWASLVALGAKAIETRSWPTSHRGPLAIHAAKSLAGLRTIECDYEDGWAVGALDGDDSRTFHWQRIVGSDVVEMYEGGRGPVPLPLGAVVATCALVDVVPIVDDGGMPGAGGCVVIVPKRPPRFISTAPFPPLVYMRDVMETGRAIGDQLPYGDFSPGRWAWLLADVVALDEPVPARGRQGIWEWSP